MYSDLILQGVVTGLLGYNTILSLVVILNNNLIVPTCTRTFLSSLQIQTLYQVYRILHYSKYPVLSRYRDPQVLSFEDFLQELFLKKNASTRKRRPQKKFQVCKSEENMSGVDHT